MRTLRQLLIVIVLLGLSLPLAAQNTFILTVSPANANTVLSKYGLTIQKELYDGPNCVYQVSSASTNTAALETAVTSDAMVAGFESDQSARMPELSGLTGLVLTQSTATILDTLPGSTAVNFFGTLVPSNYTSQAAASIIRLGAARSATALTGAGEVVAIIDTGVDPSHSVLASVLQPGFDFTRNIGGASEWTDLDPTLSARLQQSTATILDGQSVQPLSASTAVILDQSTATILDQSTATILDSNYPEFGHGTMVAGIVHLVAPAASILPLKAFRADGTSSLSNIIQAIYYAADHGANVISMSFDTPQASASLQAAVQYALNKNISVIAASGNDGLKTLVYPASIGGVQGVGSTTNTDSISSFSNYGSGVVLFAAPGEGVITTYPAGSFAAAWGTSFSTPMVAGAAALVLQARPLSKPGDVTNALSKAVQISNMGGYGRIDLYQALTNLLSGSGSNTSGSTSGSSSTL
ncbi:MAG: S8 family peptidase [Actinomycetota bacterium]